MELAADKMADRIQNLTDSQTSWSGPQTSIVFIC